MNALLSAGKREVSKLKPHPLNAKIYGDEADDELVESIRQKGILSPLLIAHNNRIISGHRRWSAAKLLGLAEVPVVVFGSEDDLDIEEALIEANRQRVKSNEQIGREYKHLKRIIAAKESRQGQRNDLTSVNQLTEVPKPTQKAADKLGVSTQTANAAERVVDAIDALEEAGDEASAEHLRHTLESSVKGAYTEAKNGGLIPEAPKPAPKPSASIISVEQWNGADLSQRAEWLFEQHAGKSTFNETNDNVEWAAWTWNPVTGCLHDCAYCYARDIANRFFEQKFTPSFLPSRLLAPAKTKTPDLNAIADPIQRMARRNVFVCSMADLFGKWVPTEWIDAVLQQAWDNPQWTFLFLTKFPIRMADFAFPPNSWIGTTVDRQYAVERAEKAFRKIRAGGYQGVAWLSCEPMMERLQFSSLDMFDWVIMGGSSKSTQTPEFRPPFEWIVDLWTQAKRLSLPVYMKTNLGIEQRVREYPSSVL